MSSDLSKCYELLGVKPGVSAAELKAAYRDMAKVWHPDRFGHDERLQKKAQEKLKEINEAYEALISGKAARPISNSSTGERRTSTPRDVGFDPARHTYSTTRSANPSRSFSWHWIVVPLLVFGVVFFMTNRSLLRSSQVGNVTSPETSSSADTSAHSERDREAVSNGSSRNRNQAESESQGATKPGEIASTQPTVASSEPMKTVTVLIDPSTGLIAQAECPTKTRMTYPAGNEPHGSCTASHPSKTQARSDTTESNESGLKSFSKRVVSPGKWLGGGDKN